MSKSLKARLFGGAEKNDLADKADEIENILESMNDNFIALDKNFKLTFINKAALKLYDMQGEQLIDKNLWDVLPNGKELRFYEELKKALDERVAVQFEEYSPLIGKWIYVNAYPTRNGLAVYFRDITEQKRLRDILKENEYNLRALINNTSDFIWSVDKDLNIIQINQPFVDFIHSFTGKVLRPGDSVVSDDFGPAMREKWQNYFQRALSGQTFLIVDEETIGTTKHHREKRFKPIFSEDGEVMGVSVFARDISEQTRLNDKILIEDKKLRAIINNTDDIIWLINDHMETISANDAYYKRVAYLTNNKHADQLTEGDFSKDRIDRWKSYYTRALNDEVFKVIEEEEMDGRKVYEEVRFHPIHDNDNKVVGVNCMSRNITAEKEHLMKIQEQNERLNEIASMQSHQVRGPIATILGLAQLINEENPSDISNKIVLEGIKEVSSDLDKLIKDIVAKTNAAKM